MNGFSAFQEKMINIFQAFKQEYLTCKDMNKIFVGDDTYHVGQEGNIYYHDVSFYQGKVIIL